MALVCNLVEWLEKSAVRYAGSTAVESSGGKLTFSELREKALHIARTIARHTAGKNHPVAIYLGKDIPFVYSMLGVLYSGNFYVPCDSRSPLLRTERILKQIGASVIITDTAGYRSLSRMDTGDAPLINLDDVSFQQAVLPDFDFSGALASVVDTDPAFVLFTSGSTSDPKGVIVSHARVIEYISWAMDYFGVAHSDVLGNQAPFFFTVSVMDVYLSMAAGAKICLIPENLFSAPSRLVDYITQHEVTQIFWVPTAYAGVAKSGALSEKPVASLKRALFVGEPMNPAVLNYWLSSQPKTEYYNLYGSTELDMVACYPIRTPHVPEGRTIPVGHPRKNVEIRIADENGGLLKTGIGELIVSGRCLSSGYWNPAKEDGFQEEKSGGHLRRRLFRTGDLAEWDSDGNIILHGRRDHQFKRMGYRIEASEIEAAAYASGFLQSACALFDDLTQNLFLIYCAENNSIERQLLAFLVRRLPSYMLPSRFVFLEKMPYTQNGKLDRVSLKNKYTGDHANEHG